MIDLERLAQAPAESQPFPYFGAPGLLGAEDLAAITRDFPDIRKPGLFQISDLTYGPAFARLIDELRAPAFARVMEAKLGVELVGKPMMMTVRGWCSPKRDGFPHTDSEDKLASGLFYLNEAGWDEAGGRLRFLGSGDVEDMIAEYPPTGGTLVGFRRTANSWHGHHPFEGQRRYVMFAWLRSKAALAKNVGRHKLSAAVKRLDFFNAG